MRRWNRLSLIAVAMVLASCMRQIEVTPTPTAMPVLSHEDVARQLTQRVTNNLRRLSQLNALCDNALNYGINAYHEAIRDTFTLLLSQPESRLFDLNELQIILTQGIEQASDILPPTAQPHSTVAPQLSGQTVDGREVILATWGNAPCHLSGHVHAGTDLYVYDTTGQVLLTGGAEEVSVRPAKNGWLVLGGDIFGKYRLWHVHPVNNHWESETLFYEFKISQLAINERTIQVSYAGPSDQPPCRFRPEVADTFDHALISGGERVWMWRDNAYRLESDRFEKAEVYLWPAGEMFKLLDDWQKYCMD
jgi:hypothetical protein